MLISFTFYPQQKEKSPQIKINNAVKTSDTTSSLFLFKKLEKVTPYNEVENLQMKKVDEILAELNSLIGLTSVKKLIVELQAFIEIQKKREKENLLTEPLVLHAIFKGNPGTGKTTVARILGNLFKEMGILKKGHVIEVERADLVGEYIGHTALKTREQIKCALGGVLFLDEAYSIARGGEKDFGKEAIDALVKAMEDHKNDLILILAGYKEEMSWFLQTNPGLRSRFPLQIDFPDYNTQELMLIAEQMLEKRQYQLTKEAKSELEDILIQETTVKHEHSGNARLVRNLIEKIIRRQAVRLINQIKVTRDDLILITWQDLKQA